MAVTSGFFDARLIEGLYDRVYNSSEFGSMFDGVINDGVFGSIGNKLKVVSSSGYTVNVSTGKAWFDGTWIKNSAIYPLTLDSPPTPQSRIDAIVVDVNKDNSVRATTLKVVKGTAAVNPVRPSLITESDHKQYALAYIDVNSDSTGITESNITDNRGTSGCPFVSAVNPSITVDELITQWRDRFDVLYAEMEAAIQAVGELTIPNNSVSAAKIQNGAVSTFYTSAIDTEWSGNQPPYTKTVSISGILSTDNPIIDVALSDEYSEAEQQLDAWGSIYKADAENNAITFYANSIPSVSIPIKILCVRK